MGRGYCTIILYIVYNVQDMGWKRVNMEGSQWAGPVYEGGSPWEEGGYKGDDSRTG